MHEDPSVAWNNSSATERIFMKLNIDKSYEKRSESKFKLRRFSVVNFNANKEVTISLLCCHTSPSWSPCHSWDVYHYGKTRVSVPGWLKSASLRYRKCLHVVFQMWLSRSRLGTGNRWQSLSIGSALQVDVTDHLSYLFLHTPIMAQQTKIKGKLQGNVPAFLRDSRDHLSERETEKKVFESSSR